MKTVFSSFIITISFALLLWILISWCNVLCHNGYGDDGHPSDWNAFIVLTEVDQ